MAFIDTAWRFSASEVTSQYAQKGSLLIEATLTDLDHLKASIRTSTKSHERAQSYRGNGLPARGDLMQAMSWRASAGVHVHWQAFAISHHPPARLFRPGRSNSEAPRLGVMWVTAAGSEPILPQVLLTFQPLSRSFHPILTAERADGGWGCISTSPSRSPLITVGRDPGPDCPHGSCQKLKCRFERRLRMHPLVKFHFIECASRKAPFPREACANSVGA
jgi:hypothetical protein